MSEIEQKFFVPGPLPGMNEIIAANLTRKGKWSEYAAMKRFWNYKISIIIKAEKIKPVEMCYILFIWTEGRRNRDPDNIVAGKKFILDALQITGVISNDGWKNIQSFRDIWLHDKDPLANGVTVIIRAH